MVVYINSGIYQKFTPGVRRSLVNPLSLKRVTSGKMLCSNTLPKPGGEDVRTQRRNSSRMDPNNTANAAWCQGSHPHPCCAHLFHPPLGLEGPKSLKWGAHLAHHAHLSDTLPNYCFACRPPGGGDGWETCPFPPGPRLTIPSSWKTHFVQFLLSVCTVMGWYWVENVFYFLIPSYNIVSCQYIWCGFLFSNIWMKQVIVKNILTLKIKAQ